MMTCQAGHERHDRLMVETVVGNMMVFDFEKYQGQEGVYCTGQDDISRTLKNVGVWGEAETELVGGLLRKGDRNNLVIDFGAHIGYYTILAAKLGYKVISYEGNVENNEVLISNAKLNGVTDKVTTHCRWINEDCPILMLEEEIELVKIDLEGAERFAIDMLEELLKHRRIKHLFVEVSPVFNGSYPAMVKKICDYGYTAYLDGELFNADFNFSQENLLFMRNQ